MLKDREAVLRTLKRAEQAGCTTLLFTVDLPCCGARWRDTRNGMLEAGALGKGQSCAKYTQAALALRGRHQG